MSDTLVGECLYQVHNNWVYYDFPTTCNNYVDYTLLSGNTWTLTEGCSSLYPAQITGTFYDTAAPSIKIDGLDCEGHTINAETCGSSSVAVWAHSAEDDCDANPTFVSSTHQSGSSFPIGNTPVTVKYTDNRSHEATCNFNVLVNACPSPAPSAAPPPACPVEQGFCVLPSKSFLVLLQGMLLLLFP